jgi:hypothetical protein
MRIKSGCSGRMNGWLSRISLVSKVARIHLTHGGEFWVHADYPCLKHALGVKTKYEGIQA